ncbi:MAG: 1-acyl-sn-glycerol-3-phosphate acyltransferase [Betaproteobacteria bacterium]|nr:1-acyl-sn-glycerol-3-phosphate acyltransferase [Betaproteobacteria bacterium]
MRTDPAPLPIRFARIARIAGHIVRGLWVTGVRFPRLDAAGQDRELTRWARHLLAILNVRVTSLNEPAAMPLRSMLVANHVSWLDVMAIFAVRPAVFIAKEDIRRWPVIGPLCAQAGALFIERGNGFHARQINSRVADTLATGRLIAMFPEGMTTDGRSLNPFRGALFQSAVDADAVLHPVGIRYTGPDGRWTDAAAFVGDMSLVESMWRLVSARGLVAELRFAPAIPARSGHRRDLARLAETAIAGALNLEPPRRTPGSRSDPRDAPR